MKKEGEAMEAIRNNIVRMSQGNPGALTALIRLESNTTLPFGGYQAILILDSLEIYGADIYILFKDICLGNELKMATCLMACQLGLFDGGTLKEAASIRDRSGVSLVPVNKLCQQVQDALKGFDFSASPE